MGSNPQAVASTVLLLEPSAASALDVTGNGTLSINGALVIDSRASQAARATGNAVVEADTFDGVGYYEAVGNAVFRFGSAAQLAAPVADPLRYLPVPDLASLTVRSSAQLNISQGNVMLLPGRYIGGIHIDGKAKVSLVAGVYAIDGGMLQVTGQASLSADGALVYLNSGNAAQSLHFAGQGAIRMSPPTSGIYRGITFFQARNSSAQINLTGQQNWLLQGMIYAPAAPVMLAGNGVLSMASQYLSRTMAVHGNGQFNIAGPGSSPPIGCAP